MVSVFQVRPLCGVSFDKLHKIFPMSDITPLLTGMSGIPEKE